MQAGSLLLAAAACWWKCGSLWLVVVPACPSPGDPFTGTSERYPDVIDITVVASMSGAYDVDISLSTSAGRAILVRGHLSAEKCFLQRSIARQSFYHAAELMQFLPTTTTPAPPPHAVSPPSNCFFTVTLPLVDFSHPLFLSELVNSRCVLFSRGVYTPFIHPKYVYPIYVPETFCSHPTKAAVSTNRMFLRWNMVCSCWRSPKYSNTPRRYSKITARWYANTSTYLALFQGHIRAVWLRWHVIML